ncbi:prepilin-type N-terminal cleavage/methylation domain-containing protein [bacterium]|nr:prepilin-type N-terminal cleavage/methylation domain-containing protein [bacterium]
MQTQLSRKRRGFTLIEILVVVVIIAILAAISVPIYVEYVRGARAADAQSQIGAVYNAAKMYQQDKDDWPSDIETLEEFGYLTIDESVLRKWSFQIEGTEAITATSTDEMAGGAGKVITFDILQGKFYGYGLPNEGSDLQ